MMSVRSAELLMTLCMAALSGYFMYEAAKLPVGWIEDEGPGGGFWPFWLSMMMLVSCVWTGINWLRKHTKVSQSTEKYFAPGVLVDVGVVALALFVTIALFDGIGPIPGIGVYGALPLFLFFYLRVLGKHSWTLTLICTFSIPVITFLFFEIALKITLPKGISEPLFYPLFKFFFS
ncbi:MAG: tripartite tricarboxylate transporter TctB family protein [Chromatiales bacterium]|jgi:putative tricarboxylic transport membrane protein|nr:tripartite tricarboxylate transporter TctB family protein [Chromatiales bacterium]